MLMEIQGQKIVSGCKNPSEDTISKKRRSFFHVKDDLRFFHFEANTKISQLVSLAEVSVPANEAP